MPSPTFTLVQAYEAPDFPVAHFDLYRLTSPDEADELGLEEALAEGAVVIEWPERLMGALPPQRLEVHLAAEADAPPEVMAGRRLARLAGFGAWSERARDLLRSPLAPARA